MTKSSGTGKINWFWAHRRNASLHHFSFLMHGLSGKGWLPSVDFSFDNQIVVGVPGKGCYVFYDSKQLSQNGKYKDIQKSIDSNENFVSDFRKRTDEIFGAIFFKCINIDSENLGLLSDSDLHKIYKDFLQTIMVAPIITVQLWGIEASFSESYHILSFLRKRLAQLGKSRDFELYKSLLAVNTGETVAFSEQKNFYQVASRIFENKKLRNIFISKNAKTIERQLNNFVAENTLIEKHIRKYEWLNTEYVSGGWSKEKWIDLFKKAIMADETPQQKLDVLLKNFVDLNAQRQKAIDELKPPKKVLHAIEALAEFIAQRDWTKGYFTKILLSYHKLLDEIGNRMRVQRSDLFFYSYTEIEDFLLTKKALPKVELESRKKNGFIIIIKGGKLNIVTDKSAIAKTIKAEGISEPFEKLINVSEFKGMPASRGFIRARARVLEDASIISSLKEGEVLVTYMTTIEFIPAFRKASAVITDEGGMSCHAAIISREFKLPCIVGTKVATRVVQTGDMLEVDANKGIVRIIQ